MRRREGGAAKFVVGETKEANAKEDNAMQSKAMQHDVMQCKTAQVHENQKTSAHKAYVQ